MLDCMGSCPHECRCHCHRHSGVMHIIACCGPCSCGRNIARGANLEEHEEMCHPKGPDQKT